MKRAACLIIVALAATVARADTPPWAQGVTEAQKTKAKALLDAGNALFLDKKYAEALAQYRGATEAWDHPAIRFNIVRCLIQLDRSVEASENLKIALRFGAAPLEEAVYSEALAYEKLLAKQVGDVALSCEQPGVTVSLDGKALATCPAKGTHRLASGKHVLIATKQGFVPETVDVFVVGGETQQIAVSLDPLGRAVGGGPRFYGKVALFGGAGMLVVAGGFALWGWRKYNAQFPSHCGGDRPEIDGKPACDDTGLARLDRARLYGDVATVVSIIGAATAITGAIVIWRSPKERRTVVTPTGTGVAISGTF